MPDEAAENSTEPTSADEGAVEKQDEATDNGDETTATKPQEGPPAEQPFNEAQYKAKIHKANQEAANLRKRLKDLEPLAAKAKELEDAQKTEAERLQARLDEREREIGALRKRAVKSEVRALAAAAFADPTDPEAHLDLNAYVTDVGDIDADAIKADLADLLERKPHLGKLKPAEPERRRPAPDRTQASGANQTRAKDPADEFAGFVNSRLLKSKGR
ncbi:hypothetical protein GCM10023085_45490 [Actinomadura viridis]|uniref:Scaffolding protein n=1 Tax=Actinomadura viridis TaxID=58110 RepID=A0A931DF07_9ACTN|nr:hypothetical protein [Actinomadura viridis]MBG6089909.1 hypothetical protein [Actinomadura viridis]